MFWDIFGRKRHPIPASVQQVGATLMARTLGQDEVQAGALAVLFTTFFPQVRSNRDVSAKASTSSSPFAPR